MKTISWRRTKRRGLSEGRAEARLEAARADAEKAAAEKVAAEEEARQEAQKAKNAEKHAVQVQRGWLEKKETGIMRADKRADDPVYDPQLMYFAREEKKFGENNQDDSVYGEQLKYLAQQGA